MDVDPQVLLAERTAFALLRSHVPLRLLVDLATPVRSQELLREEQADLSWVHAVA